MSDTGDLFKSLREETRSRRDETESYRIFRLHWARERDLLCFRKCSQYHYRVWAPDRPKRVIDYWPRTGRIIDHTESYKGWVKLMKLLGIPREKWRIPDDG